MASRATEGCLRIAALGRRAAAQRARAARASALAEVAEALAAFTSPGRVRDVHAAAASGHREAEVFHLSAAGMAECLEGRLRSWVSNPDPQAMRPRLVGVAAGMLGTASASVVLLSGTGMESRLSGSDEAAQAACEAQALTGQGPAAEASSTGQPCAATAAEIGHRWPLFAHTIGGLGIQSVIAAPLGTSDDRLGAVCGYYREPVLPATALARAGQVAAALTQLLLHEGDDFVRLLARDGGHAVIHQAEGMVSAQACCDIGQARRLLAARAFADGASLARTAAAVVRGDIQLGPIQ